MTDVTVIFEAEPNVRGSWCETTRTMRINPKLLQIERRETALHERKHALLHHDGCQPPAVERRVMRDVSRELIGRNALSEALKWSGNLHEVADELWVTPELLIIRYETAHPAERAMWDKINAAREHTA